MRGIRRLLQGRKERPCLSSGAGDASPLPFCDLMPTAARWPLTDYTSTLFLHTNENMPFSLKLCNFVPPSFRPAGFGRACPIRRLLSATMCLVQSDASSQPRVLLLGSAFIRAAAACQTPPTGGPDPCPGTGG